MSEIESARGDLSPTDTQWKAPRFMVLFVVSLGAALALIYFISSVKSGDFTWHPFAHDLERHTLESSVL